MAISFVGAAQASGATVAIPTHQAGDFIVAWTFRSGSNSAPVVPTDANWTTLLASDGTTANNSAGFALAYKIAQSNAENFGTFSNATQCEVSVYRGTATSSVIGASATATGSSAAVTYPALTAQGSASWIIAVAAHRTSTIVNTPPPGFTNRINRGAGTAALAIHDTNGVVSSSAADTETGTPSSGWRTVVFEMAGPAAGGASGQAAITEDPDTASSAAALRITASGAPTEDADTATGSGNLRLSGSAQTVEDADTASGSATLRIAGSGQATEAPDTASGTGVLAIVASAAVVEDPDTVSATGSTGQATAITGTAATTEDADTAQSSATLRITAMAALLEASDTATGTITTANRGNAALVEAPDTATGYGTGIVVPTPASRVVVARGESRTVIILGETRRVVVEPIYRNASIARETRRVTIARL